MLPNGIEHFLPWPGILVAFTLHVFGVVQSTFVLYVYYHYRFLIMSKGGKIKLAPLIVDILLTSSWALIIALSISFGVNQSRKRGRDYYLRHIKKELFAELGERDL